MRPVQEKLREEFEKKTITKTSMEDLQVKNSGRFINAFEQLIIDNYVLSF